MTEQRRNKRCDCGSGKKYKKCCGRFSELELHSRMREFVQTNTQTHVMIERALNVITVCAEEDKSALLCLVRPTITEDRVDWTTIPTGLSPEQREALITRRALSGYIPVGLLMNTYGRKAIIDPTLIPDPSYWQFYIPFAHRELSVIASTLEGQMPMEDSWLTTVNPGDLQHPPSEGTA